MCMQALLRVPSEMLAAGQKCQQMCVVIGWLHRIPKSTQLPHPTARFRSRKFITDTWTRSACAYPEVAKIHARS